MVNTLTIGRLVLREDDVVPENSGGDGHRGLTLSGQESIPRLSASAVEKRREDILGMSGHFVPVVFSIKSYINGFYLVESTSGSVEDWGDGMKVFPWTINLTRIGTDSEVDIESRLSGAISRQNNFSVVGERIHAPSIGHEAYWSDATVSASVLRTSTEGVVRAYRGIGATISPRWMVSPVDYGKGRVRFLDDEDNERAGNRIKCNPADWEINNGLLRVRPLLASGAIEVSAWSGSAWQPKNWDIRAGTATLGVFDSCSIIYNEFEAVCIRLMKSLDVLHGAPISGRAFVDITLRRGYRFADVYVQSEFGANLIIRRATAETGTSGTAGMVIASANDADGNKYVIGSARTFTADIVNGGIEKASTATLDAFIGVVFGGTGAVSGDAAIDLQKQYIGAPSELVQGVQR
jgi:hypothetical protein